MSETENRQEEIASIESKTINEGPLTDPNNGNHLETEIEALVTSLESEMSQPDPSESGSTSKEHEQQSYQPQDVLERLKQRPGIQRAYLQEAQSLLYHIRLLGLGPALAMLLSQHDHKSKRRIYWDISKWVFKEQRIKGKNVRSLMESVVYGEPRFLLKATQSAVSYLETIIQLSQSASQQSTRSSHHE